MSDGRDHTHTLKQTRIHILRIYDSMWFQKLAVFLFCGIVCAKPIILSAPSVFFCFVTVITQSNTMDDLLCYVRFNVANNYISLDIGKTGQNSKEMAHEIYPLSLLLMPSLGSSGRKKGEKQSNVCASQIVHMLVVGSEIQL